jgi:hypothetical protein
MPFLHGSTEKQAHACKARNLGPSFKKLPKCFACEGRGGCHFIGVWLPEISNIIEGLDWLAGNRTVTHCDTLENRISFIFKEGPDPHFPTVFNREMNARDVEIKMVCFRFTGCYNLS